MALKRSALLQRDWRLHVIAHTPNNDDEEKILWQRSAKSSLVGFLGVGNRWRGRERRETHRTTARQFRVEMDNVIIDFKNLVE